MVWSFLKKLKIDLPYNPAIPLLGIYIKEMKTRFWPYICIPGLPWWLRQQKICLQCKRPGFNPWIRKIPWRREWQPTPVLLPGESHGHSSLAGDSPWCCKELDMTEQLTVACFLMFTAALLTIVKIWKQPDGHQQISSVQSLSRVQLWDPMDHSMPGLPVHHELLESTQTHVHWVRDAIQPSLPLSSPSPPAFNLSQHQGIFQWVSSSRQVAKLLEFQLQHQFFQWTLRTDLL